MNNYKLTITYDGSRYKGWQRLKNTNNTIQGKLESVLSLLTNETIELIGSGRTDAGVHALGQVANFKTNMDLLENDILNYCYSYLPKDIIVINAEKVDGSFHSRYNAIAKDYIYKINNNPYHNPFDRKYSYHVVEPLNIKLMEKAIDCFVGEKDFKSFTSLKSKKKSTIRKINYIRLTETDGYIELLFNGNGFLYNMVRIIVGTLIDVGKGQLQITDIPYIFNKMDRSYAGPTAPAQGLFLSRVYY